MMKLLTGEWMAAEQENKALRDKLRNEFWSDVGISPARNTSEIDIAPGGRLALMQSLVEKTLGGKEGDAALKAVTSLASGKVAALAIGSFGHGGVSFAPDMVKMAPKNLRQFSVDRRRNRLRMGELRRKQLKMAGGTAWRRRAQIQALGLTTGGPLEQ